MRPRYSILTLLLVLLGTSCQRQTAEAPARPVADPVVRPAVSSKLAAKAPGRPVFPYSVVSGGLTDSTEMADAIQQDPVVREHYAGLRPARFHTVVLPEDRKGYVSYRIRGKVYWSRRLMTLKKGETVLTDGDTMLRGRCGNRVSSVAMSPTAPAGEEPTEAVLNSWQDSRLLAGIPPVPVASPIDGTLHLDRSAPGDPGASSLLVPLDSDVYGYFLPPPGTASPGGIWIGGSSPNPGGGSPNPGGGSVGGGPGGEPIGGGTPPTVPPVTIPGIDPSAPPPFEIIPPNIITSIPPTTGLPLPPETVYLPPVGNPPGIQPPNVPWPPTVSYPPTSFPPGVDPPSTPPGTPPTEVPPGAGDPPSTNPPTVSDPPPGVPPPGPPEDETAVPEPATVLLAASALALLGAGRYFARRRR